MSEYNYLATIQPLSEEDGGGYLVSFPDLPGCIADGATPEEAFHQAEDAMIAWIATAKESGDLIPKPSTPSRYNGTIPELFQKAIFGLLLFPYLALKKIRHSPGYDSSFSKPGTKKSRRPKHSLLKQFGYSRLKILPNIPIHFP